jgi:asparagine synthetase B (glutamine-hydrolysing)
MCGFIAVFGKLTPEQGRMVDHRGKRTSISTIVGGLTFVHARLPIVGVGVEHDQPIWRGHWLVSFVGELLDFREIYPGSECDVDVVADTVASGWDDFRRFDGFWSVAAYDTDRGELHLQTDYLAQKPVYYRIDMQAAASEPDALVSLKRVTPDEVYFADVAKWGYCPETWRTPYQEVRKMLPGYHLTMAKDGINGYYHVDPLKLVFHNRAALKIEIEAAVKRRVTSSDVPVACLLSGGLDSSIVYTIAKRYGDVRPYFVPIGPDAEEEHRRACEVAGRFVPVVHPPSALPAVEQRIQAMWEMQEPVDLGSLVPQAILSAAIGEDVCLTGDGADEFFGGYGRALRYDSQASDVWQELVAWHLPRLDRIMMRNCVEVRSPFLSRGVASAALALDYPDRRGKAILREMFKDVLPASVLAAPKIPLRTPDVADDPEQVRLYMIQRFRARQWPGEMR